MEGLGGRRSRHLGYPVRHYTRARNATTTTRRGRTTPKLVPLLLLPPTGALRVLLLPLALLLLLGALLDPTACSLRNSLLVLSQSAPFPRSLAPGSLLSAFQLLGGLQWGVYTRFREVSVYSLRVWGEKRGAPTPASLQRGRTLPPPPSIRPSSSLH